MQRRCLHRNPKGTATKNVLFFQGHRKGGNILADLFFFFFKWTLEGKALMEENKMINLLNYSMSKFYFWISSEVKSSQTRFFMIFITSQKLGWIRPQIKTLPTGKAATNPQIRSMKTAPSGRQLLPNLDVPHFLNCGVGNDSRATGGLQKFGNSRETSVVRYWACLELEESLKINFCLRYI